MPSDITTLPEGFRLSLSDGGPSVVVTQPDDTRSAARDDASRDDATCEDLWQAAVVRFTRVRDTLTAAVAHG